MTDRRSQALVWACLASSLRPPPGPHGSISRSLAASLCTARRACCLAWGPDLANLHLLPFPSNSVGGMYWAGRGCRESGEPGADPQASGASGYFSTVTVDVTPRPLRASPSFTSTPAGGTVLSWPPPPAPTPRPRVGAHSGPPLRTRTFAPLAVAAAWGNAGMHLTEAGASLQEQVVGRTQAQGGGMLWTGPGLCQAGAMRPPEGGQQPCAQCPAPSQWSARHRCRVAAICCPGPTGKACRHGDTKTHAALCGRPRLQLWDTWTAALEVGIWSLSPVGTQPTWKARWDT